MPHLAADDSLDHWRVAHDCNPLLWQLGEPPNELVQYGLRSNCETASSSKARLATTERQPPTARHDLQLTCLGLLHIWVWIEPYFGQKVEIQLQRRSDWLAGGAHTHTHLDTTPLG